MAADGNIQETTPSVRPGAGGPGPRAAQFWLPSIFRLDEEVCGALQAPPTEGPENAAHWAFLRALFPDVLTGSEASHPKKLIAYLMDYLDELNPGLTALLMAGYAVPSIEFGFPASTYVPDPSMMQGPGVVPPPTGGEADLEARILRIDLRTRQVSVNLRTPEYGDGIVVRPVVLRLSEFMDVSSLDIGADRLALFLSTFDPAFDREDEAYPRPINDQGRALLAEPAHTMLNSAFTSPTSGVAATMFGAESGQSRTVMEQRSFVLDQFIAMIGQPLGANMTLGVAFTNSQGGAVAVREATLKGALHGILNPITWYVGQVLGEEAAKMTIAAGSHEAAYAGNALPGLLWVFNPMAWDDLNLPARGTYQPNQDVKALVTVFRHMHYCLTIDGFQDFVDDDPGDGKPWFKTYGLLDALGYATHFDLRRTPGLRCKGMRAHAPVRVIETLIGGQIGFDRRTVRRSNRKRPGGKAEQNDPTVKINASLEGMLSDMSLSMQLVPWLNDQSGSIEAARDRINAIVSDFVRAAATMAIRYPSESGSYRHKKQMFADTGVFNVLLALFNRGTFSIQGTIGDLSEVLKPEVIFTKEGPADDPTFRLRHNLHSQPGITLRQENKPKGADGEALNIPPERSFAWELIPPIKLGPAPSEALKRAANVPPPQERLVIVAGPGVEISGREGWPSQLEIEIIRVQSPALVPDPGERINMTMLQAPYPIGILDGMERSAADYPTPPPVDPDTGEPNISPLLPFYNAAMQGPKNLPFVTVRGLQKEINGTWYSGVQITSNHNSNVFYLGTAKKFVVDILMPEGSGTDRFAFDIRYKLHNVSRVVGSREEIRDGRGGRTRVVTIPIRADIDIAQFDVVVHRTDNVRIDIQDDAAGPIDWLVDTFVTQMLELRFGVDIDTDLPSWGREPATSGIYHLFYVNGFDDVPDQGTILDCPLTSTKQTELGLTLSEYDEVALTWDTTVTLATTAVDVGVGFIPIVGDVVDVAEFALSFVTGCDRWGRPITNFDRALMFGGMCLPFVGSRALRALKGEVGHVALEGASGLIDDVARHSDQLDTPEFMDWIIDGTPMP